MPDLLAATLAHYSHWELALAIAAITAGTLTQGAVGFGFALISAPILLLIDPLLVPVPLTLVALWLTGSSFQHHHDHVDWRGLGWIFLGNLPGYALGAVALTLLPIRELALLFGLLTLVTTALSVAHLHLTPVPRWLVPMGAFSAFMGTTMGMNGPPVALLYQHAHGNRIRGTLGVYFFTSNLVLVAIYWAVARIDSAALGAALVMLPGVWLGLLLVRPLRRWFDAGRMRGGVLWISAFSAVAVLWRYL